MHHYMISYDNITKSEDRKVLSKAILTIDKNADNVLDSQWIIQSSESLEKLFLVLAGSLGQRGDLLICRLGDREVLGFSLRNKTFKKPFTRNFFLRSRPILKKLMSNL